MPNNDYPIYNGIAPSWADVICRAQSSDLPLIEMKDIKSIGMVRTVEEGVQRATGGRVMRRTAGQPSYEYTWTMYRSAHLQLITALAPLAPLRGNVRRVSLVFFDVQVQHTPPGSVEVFERRAKGIRILGDTMNMAEGTEADVVDVPCSVIEIVDVVNGEEIALL
jgi:hypothetical protein